MDSVKIEGDSRASIGCSTAYTVEIQMICPERAKSKPPTERYEIIENIGSGSYGYVCKALCKKSGETVAIKIIELEGSQDELEDIEAEVKIMSRTSSDHIVRFYASYIVNTDLWIVMEYCTGGACADLICDGGLQEQYVFVIAREVLKGLDYLHSGGNLHRDIKAANILICGDGSVKLADFGVSGQLSASATRRNTFVGTPYWMAPEVINQTGYNASADIWSLGITIIEISEGRPPHSSMHPMKALFAIPRYPSPKLSKKFSKTLRDFVELCLNKSPELRPTAKELLKHKVARSAGKNSTLLEIVNASSKSMSKSKPVLSSEIVPEKINRHRKTKADNVFWNFDTFKDAPIPNDDTIKMRQSDPQKETVEHEQVKRSKYGEGLQSPDDRIPLIAVREVSLPTTYYDRAVVCPPARNMLDESKPNTRSSDLLSAITSNAEFGFDSHSSNEEVYQKAVLNSLISSIDRASSGSRVNGLKRAMDRLKASILECEKVLPGCVTVLIEDVVSSVETRYR